MADGPVINIAIDDSGLKALEARVASARANVAAANKEVRDLGKQGQQVGRELSTKLGNARKELELAQGTLKGARQQYRDQQNAPFDNAAEARMASAIGRRFDRVFGGGFARKLLSGEKIDATDILRESVGLERLGQKIGRAAGLKNADVMAAGALIPIVSQAVIAVMEGFQKAKEEKEFGQEIGRKYGLGLLSKEEFEFYQRGNDQWFGDPTKRFEEFEKAAEGFAKLGFVGMEKAVDKARKAAIKEIDDYEADQMDTGMSQESLDYDTQKKNKIRAALNPQSLRNAIEMEIDKERERLGTEPDSATQHALAKKVFAQTFNFLGGDPTEIEKAVESIVKEMEDVDARANVQQMAYITYQKRREKQMYEINFAIMDRRTPANPMD